MSESPKSSVSRQKRDPEATRNAILDAAEALFIEHGIAATPTSRIARRAGVTKSLIHHHFGSKESLWDEIKRRRFSTYYELQYEMLASAEGTADLLRASIIAFFRFLQSDPEAVRFMSWRFVDAEDPSLEQEKELYEIGMQRIREAQEAGQLRADVEPITMLKAFLGLALHWFQSRPMLAEMLGPEADLDAIEEQYIEDVLRLYFEGVLPR